MIERIMKWQKDRLLDKQRFDIETELTNIFEEIYEMFEIDEPREIAMTSANVLSSYNKLKDDDSIIDSFADIIVFSVGAMMKLGYDPVKVIDEVLKEIESRKGSIINGKFVKDTSEEAKSRWYKANFRKCKIDDNCSRNSIESNS